MDNDDRGDEGTVPDGKRVQTLDADWPGQPLPAMPGDFSSYVPEGMGLDVAPVVRPWDDPSKALSTPSYYGFQARNSDPIRGAPLHSPSGGVIYFEDMLPQIMRTVLAEMGVMLDERAFVVFAGSARDPLSERYLDQARIMRTSALRHLFRPGPAAAQLQPQPVTIGEYIEQFLARQGRKWNQPGHPFSPALYGAFGGDGDWAKEALCFGLMVENVYWGIYRIWSRAWLVTK